MATKKTTKKKTTKNENKLIIMLEEPIEVSHSGMSSVEMKRNSKGIVEFVVKVYDSSPDKAKKIASEIFKDLNKKFPN